MMLREVLDEIVRRRLWPIPAIAIAVALAGPLLFLKSAPQDAPAPAAAMPSTQLDLPARAQRLLTSTDASATARRRLSRTARDPFRAPTSRRKTPGGSNAKKSAASKTKAQASSSPGSKPTSPVPVIVVTPKGSTTKASAPATTPSGGSSGTSKSGDSSGTSSPRSSASSGTPTVDMRFGAEKDSPIHREIPRLKTFEVGDKIAVVFVKYSPSRHEAIFAIDPSTTVRGDVDCRRVDGLCRYVDIPAGKYARLTFVKDDGSRVSRRLDVVRVHGDAHP
jgi:hypothetical protein